MAAGNYVPDRDSDKVTWLNNFVSKFSGYASLLGFTSEEAGQINDDAIMFAYCVGQVVLFKTEKQERVKFKNLVSNGAIGTPIGDFPSVPTIPSPPDAVPAGIFKRMAKTVQRIKNHPKYTDIIGKDLGIIGAEDTFNPDEYKTELTTEVFPGHVRISFVKGDVEAVNIHSRTEGETDWVFLATDQHSPYNDSRPLADPNTPETREYMGMGVIDDEEIGQPSDIASAVFGG